MPLSKYSTDLNSPSISQHSSVPLLSAFPSLSAERKGVSWWGFVRLMCEDLKGVEMGEGGESSVCSRLEGQYWCCTAGFSCSMHAHCLVACIVLEQWILARSHHILSALPAALQFTHVNCTYYTLPYSLHSSATLIKHCHILRISLLYKLTAVIHSAPAYTGHHYTLITPLLYILPYTLLSYITFIQSIILSYTYCRSCCI